MEARSPFFESTVYKSFALQKVRKTLRLEGAKLTYRKDEGDDVEEGRMRLTASSTVVATSNMHRKRQGKRVPCGVGVVSGSRVLFLCVRSNGDGGRSMHPPNGWSDRILERKRQTR